MKPKDDKPMLCPNCFGSEFREVFSTATSRNSLDDDPVTAAFDGSLDTSKRKDVVKILCAHCGHELHRGGNRG